MINSEKQDNWCSNGMRERLRFHKTTILKIDVKLIWLGLSRLPVKRALNPAPSSVLHLTIEKAGQGSREQTGKRGSPVSLKVGGGPPKLNYLTGLFFTKSKYGSQYKTFLFSGKGCIDYL